YWYPAAFVEGSHRLDLVLGSINTMVLLTSSLTMALAVHAAQTSDRRGQVRNLALTLLLGCTFLAIKGYEYHQKFEEHLVPGQYFVQRHARERAPGAEPQMGAPITRSSPAAMWPADVPSSGER